MEQGICHGFAYTRKNINLSTVDYVCSITKAQKCTARIKFKRLGKCGPVDYENPEFHDRHSTGCIAVNNVLEVEYLQDKSVLDSSEFARFVDNSGRVCTGCHQSTSLKK